MSLFQAFRGNGFDNTNRLARIAYRLNLYGRMLVAARGRVPVTQLVRSQFPYLLPDAKTPPALSVELTNYCNLACPYCTSPLKRREQGMMLEETFANLVKQVKDSRIPRVGLVGNGESTLHPEFSSYLPRLKEATSFLTLTTNMQRVNHDILSATVKHVDVVNISVDGGDKQGYEAMRIQGNFEKLLANLQDLNDLKERLRSETVINIRLMLRPSEKDREAELLEFWKARGDIVSRQYIVDFLENSDDGFTADYEPKARCTLPAKVLDVHWNGNVPLCSYSETQTGKPDGLVIGNINENTLSDIWQGELIRQYRMGHRQKNPELTLICAGCTGRT